MPHNDYTLLSPLDTDWVRFRFEGPFQGQSVVWDATLMTLQHYARELAADGEPVRNFIDIGAPGPEGYALTIGLDVPTIDAPTVARAMIMIRQYRRLAPGRHEYGAAVRFEHG